MPILEFFILLVLIVLNGFFAMSELAIVSARRGRLEQRAAEGDKGAERAIRLAEDPTGFLSTVQVGITLIGIFAGAYSGANFAEPLAGLLEPVFGSGQAVYGVALGLVVLATTYLSLVIGELAPKRIALNHAEAIASFASGPMTILSTVGAPIVWLLRVSTNGILRLAGLQPGRSDRVTEEDVRAIIIEGTETGVLKPAEGDMLEGVMRVADRQVRSIMVPRHEVEWLNGGEAADALVKQIRQSGHARYPLCRGELDEVIGILHVRDLLEASSDPAFNLEKAARPPVFVSETMPVMRLLDRFRGAQVHMAIVLDEYGSVEGIVTPTDILVAIAGDFPGEEGGTPDAIRRADGSWLLEGAMTIDEVSKSVENLTLPEEGDYVTLAGFILHHLGHIPEAGEILEIQGWRIEVVDLDGRRIDKVLAIPLVKSGEER